MHARVLPCHAWPLSPSHLPYSCCGVESNKELDCHVILERQAKPIIIHHPQAAARENTVLKKDVV
jgi:hypothetical protein